MKKHSQNELKKESEERKIMEKISGKLAPVEQQPIRKHRIVFTSTKGLLKKKRWKMLDMDEYGLSYSEKPHFSGQMMSAIYAVLEEIVLDGRSFTLTIKNNCNMVYKIDLYQLDGDLWSNFIKIRDLLTTFSGDKLILK